MSIDIGAILGSLARIASLNKTNTSQILVMAHSSSIASILLVRISRVSIALASISMIFTGPANIKRYSLVLALSSLWKDSLLVLLPGMTL
jgi:hypothetical protein